MHIQFPVKPTELESTHHFQMLGLIVNDPENADSHIYTIIIVVSFQILTEP